MKRISSVFWIWFDFFFGFTYWTRSHHYLPVDASRLRPETAPASALRDPSDSTRVLLFSLLFLNRWLKFHSTFVLRLMPFLHLFFSFLILSLSFSFFFLPFPSLLSFYSHSSVVFVLSVFSLRPGVGELWGRIASASHWRRGHIAHRFFLDKFSGIVEFLEIWKLW